jgi:hypothetical protein
VSPPPPQAKIYHIVHVDRLGSIIADGGLCCDQVMAGRSGTGTVIGMSAIKERRLRLPVSCHPGTTVGEYVPFYFCPRSVMLYLIHKANHPELAYRGGQGPILHLQADVNSVVAWASSVGVRWAFTASNAGARYTPSWCTPEDLSRVDWEAVARTDFHRPEIKEAKQAEFLVHKKVPWEQVELIGAQSAAVASQAQATLASATHRPLVRIRTDWYY